MSSFISRIAQEIVSSPVPLHKQMVVLPNQRAEIFLREALKSHLDKPTLLPLFVTVDGFISDAGNLLVVEPLVLLIELHKAYCQARQEAHPEQNVESLGSFLSWGRTLLSDFEEIDRYKLKPQHVLEDLYNVQKITEWDLEPENTTALMGRYSEFIAVLPSTYEYFKNALLNRGEAYVGLASRYLSENTTLIDNYLNKNGVKRIIVAGLNALNTSELDIIAHLKMNWETKIMWDLDSHYMDMKEHEAGLFLRLHQKRQKVFGNDIPSTKNLISDLTTLKKDIRIVGASKYSGQAKVIAATLEQWALEKVQPNNIAIILADETLLNPVLSVLPAAYDKVNVTMGYPLDHTRIASTLRLWIGAIEYAVKNAKSETNWTFYHRSLSALFSDPLFCKYWYNEDTHYGPHEWNKNIIQANRVFTSSKEWKTELSKGPCGYHNLLQPTKGLKVLESIKNWLKHVAEKEKVDSMVINTSYKVHVLLEQLERTIEGTEIDTLTVLKLIKQQLKSSTIDFIGEPLEGIQIMGILESRTLDFSHIIMAGVNEGTLPAGRNFNSLLPYDVKKAHDLPTYEQKDAIYAYHFYRVLQRCSQSVITFNTSRDAFGGGEPSRYIIQLEQELNTDHCTIHPRQFMTGNVVSGSIEDRFYAERSPSVKEAMKEWMNKGISASSLNDLMERPHVFYQKKIVGLSEEDEVEESMSALVMGNLVHYGLEHLYRPFEGKSIPEFNVDEWTNRAMEAGVQRLVEEGTSAASLNQGRNLVTQEVCKKMLHQFLSFDSNRIKTGQVILKGIETKLEFRMIHPALQIPLYFIGYVDRIESHKGNLKIWDYKTGNIPSIALSASRLEDVWLGKKPKVLQCLFYAWLLWKSNTFQHPFPWSLGMLKLQSSRPEMNLKGKAFPTSEIEEADLKEFEDQLLEFLMVQLSTKEPFVAPPAKPY